MNLKKLIAISVVFALVAGVAFAVDVSGEIIGTVEVLKGDNSEKADGDPKVFSSGDLNRIRLEGSGENDDGTFGAWIRLDGGSFYGNAWWKPINQLLLRIGSNGYDGFFGKDGHTRWMFYQRASDPGVTYGGANAWGDSIYGEAFGLNASAAFFGGNGGNAFRATISPVEIVDVNIEIPFFDGGDAKDVFKKMVGQLDFKLNFGSVALTYVGGINEYTPAVPKVAGTAGTTFYEIWDSTSNTFEWKSTKPGDTDIVGRTQVVGATPGTDAKDASIDPGTFFAYFGLTSIENLGIDVGIGFPLPLSKDIGGVKYTRISPISAGLGAQYSAGSLGVKTRIVASFAGSTKTDVSGADPVNDPFKLLFDVLPYYGLRDDLKVFLSAGLGLATHKDWDDPFIGWHVNPYVWIGQEWGPSFWAGFKLDGNNNFGVGDGVVNWSIPIAIGVSF